MEPRPLSIMPSALLTGLLLPHRRDQLGNKGNSQDHSTRHAILGDQLSAIGHLDPAVPACDICLQIVELLKSVFFQFVPGLAFITGKGRLRTDAA